MYAHTRIFVCMYVHCMYVYVFCMYLLVCVMYVYIYVCILCLIIMCLHACTSFNKSQTTIKILVS